MAGREVPPAGGKTAAEIKVHFWFVGMAAIPLRSSRSPALRICLNTRLR